MNCSEYVHHEKKDAKNVQKKRVKNDVNSTDFNCIKTYIAKYNKLIEQTVIIAEVYRT